MYVSHGAALRVDSVNDDGWREEQEILIIKTQTTLLPPTHPFIHPSIHPLTNLQPTQLYYADPQFPTTTVYRASTGAEIFGPSTVPLRD